MSVNSVLEKLLESSNASVSQAGESLLQFLSGGVVSREDFLRDPHVLIGPPHFVSRYVGQVALRALAGEYETVDEIIANLAGLVDRNPPTIEPKRDATTDRVVIPEAKVLGLRYPIKQEDGSWESAVEALVTTGPLRDREIEIRVRSSANPTACFIVPHFWIHSTIAAYNLVPAGDRQFEACSDTFFVLEPLHQVNATAVARSLYCSKPQVDQIRRGRGDVTAATIRGMLVHALFDRMLEGAKDLEAAYGEILPNFLVPLASVTDRLFNEAAFRADILRHARALGEFIDRNPHLLENPQLELKRYSATIGIQGRIDAVFRQGNRLDILELKTGMRIRPEDHAQLFIYRLLLSDLVRRWKKDDGEAVELTSRLLSSYDGTFAPLRVTTDFHQILDARNKLVAATYALSRSRPHITLRYAGFNADICGRCPSWTRQRCEESSKFFGDRPDSPQHADLEYFRKFSMLVEREKWYADQELADLLDDSRLEFRVRNFRTICGARIVLDGDPFVFEFPENTSDLGPGDDVLVHAGRISSSAIYHGSIRSIDRHRARIAIPLKNLKPEVFEGREWIIDRFPTDYTSEASHTALYDFLFTAEARRRGAVNERPVSVSPRLRGELNTSQEAAIQRAVSCSDYHLIWGPPGTGKTKVIPEIIAGIDGPVLIGAFTNTAVDKMLLALLDHDPSTRFLRVGRSGASPEVVARLRGDPADFFSDDLARKYRNVRDVKQALESAPIVAATAHRASTSPYIRNRPFEMTIVDEAAQLTEPLTLGLILRARRFVLIGDDRQLPPVTRTHRLRHSMFERLKKAAEGGAPDRLTLLDTQYRMHPAIMDVSNTLFYRGQLRSGVTAEDRCPPAGQPVVWIPVDSDFDSRVNPVEARVVARLVRELAESTEPESIGVVSPFRAQVVLLRQMLEDVPVTIDTVERFQGGERDIMVLSFVRSRGTAFVFDDRRLNVAITRARRKLVLVAHPELFRNTRYAWISTFTEPPQTSGTT